MALHREDEDEDVIRWACAHPSTGWKGVRRERRRDCERGEMRTRDNEKGSALIHLW